MSLDAMRDELVADLERLNWEREQHASLLAATEDCIERMRTALRGVECALGITPTKQPRGAAAVEAVARSADHPLTVREIVAELDRRGWSPESKDPERATRAAMQRLRNHDPKWLLADGRFRYEGDSVDARI